MSTFDTAYMDPFGPEETIIPLEGGEFLAVPPHWHPNVAAKIVGFDEGSGLTVARETFPNGSAMDFTLTPCCGSSFKGCDGYIGCRKCYEPLPELGGGVPWGPILWVESLPAEDRVIQ